MKSIIPLVFFILGAIISHASAGMTIIFLFSVWHFKNIISKLHTRKCNLTNFLEKLQFSDPVSEDEIENGLIPEIIEILEKKSSYQPWTGKKRADEEAEYRPWLGKRSNGSDKDSKEAYMWSRLKKAAKQYQWNRMRRNQYQWSRL